MDSMRAHHSVESAGHDTSVRNGGEVDMLLPAYAHSMLDGRAQSPPDENTTASSSVTSDADTQQGFSTLLSSSSESEDGSTASGSSSSNTEEASSIRSPSATFSPMALPAAATAPRYRGQGLPEFTPFGMLYVTAGVELEYVGLDRVEGCGDADEGSEEDEEEEDENEDEEGVEMMEQ